MSGPAIISSQTASELREVAAFFGIDMDWNNHIFRHAAQSDGRAFAIVMSALAEAVRKDRRFGTAQRIRAQAKERKDRR